MSASKSPRAGRFVRIAVAAAALASFASPARAADSKEKAPTSYPALQEMKPVDVMHQMDTDKDGYVTREEFLKFQEAIFSSIDKNRDRRLAEVEFTDRG